MTKIPKEIFFQILDYVLEPPYKLFDYLEPYETDIINNFGVNNIKNYYEIDKNKFHKIKEDYIKYIEQ